MSTGGRPTKCTPELTHRVATYVRQGNYLETAAAACGVNKTTLYDWMKRGAREADRRVAEDAEPEPKRVSRKRRRELQVRADRRAAEEPYLQFSNALEEALATAEVTMSLRLAKAGADGAWRADAFRLERMFPKRWGKRLRVSDEEGESAAGIPGAGADEFDLGNLSDDELSELESLLERAGGEGE